jgi:Metallo-beta-lactamase superfamily
MKLQQVSESCYAVVCEKNRVCDANSGLINLDGGVVIDTQSDLAHAQRMIELLGTVWKSMPKYVINTHEDGDHVWGNQLFKGAEIIAHKSVPKRMKDVAEPGETQELLHCVARSVTRRCASSPSSTMPAPWGKFSITSVKPPSRRESPRRADRRCGRRWNLRATIRSGMREQRRGQRSSSISASPGRSGQVPKQDETR